MKAFRYNNRKPVNDANRFGCVMRKVVGNAPAQSILLDIDGGAFKDEPGKFWPESIAMPAEEAL